MKPVIGQLVEAVKFTSGSSRLPPMKVELCLRSLIEAATDRLPPINWAAILSAISREYPGNIFMLFSWALETSVIYLTFKLEIQLIMFYQTFPGTEKLCVELAIKQGQWTPNAALYVTAQMQLPQFSYLKVSAALCFTAQM